MKRSIAILAIFAFLSISIAAQRSGEVLIKNATVLTAARGTLQGTDILIRGGKIVRIGNGLAAGASAKVIDATGKYVTPGIIDAHSHSMVSAINEGTHSVTSMTRIRDMLNPTDVTIYGHSWRRHIGIAAARFGKSDRRAKQHGKVQMGTAGRRVCDRRRSAGNQVCLG